ncbi:hypothetical protein [Streptomyces sp. NBC_00198]|uniref:hypothetical protein n=1 Tax=Streptomyces sp. NBC_00198 TaxID=2975677 RepID=UPI00225B4C81|nr:hypothetical protein [Streptomyces sp. NBC_00198]MCX5280933.1 hypothetical protein [Streptomyces sp. NBC_00198]
MTPGPLAGLEIVTSNLDPDCVAGFWAPCCCRAPAGAYAELHHHGTVLLAAYDSWHALHKLAADPLPGAGAAVSRDFIGANCRDSDRHRVGTDPPAGT